MTIAIAAMSPDKDSRIADQSARAPYYLLFDEQGMETEVISNPFTDIDRGAAPRAASLLAEKGASVLVAGDFGHKFVVELEDRRIEPVQRQGKVSDVVRQLTGQG